MEKTWGQEKAMKDSQKPRYWNKSKCPLYAHQPSSCGWFSCTCTPSPHTFPPRGLTQFKAPSQTATHLLPHHWTRTHALYIPGTWRLATWETPRLWRSAQRGRGIEAGHSGRRGLGTWGVGFNLRLTLFFGKEGGAEDTKSRQSPGSFLMQWRSYCT